MKNVIVVFLGGVGFVSSVFADSFLTAQQFPKTFEDLSFKSRIEVLRDGYKPFEVEYDENGVCISGCAYRGITIKEDMDAVDEATDEMADLIASVEKENPKEYQTDNLPTILTTDIENIPPDEPPLSTQNNSSSSQLSQSTPLVSQNNPTWYSTNEPEPVTVPHAYDWCRNGQSTKLPLRYPVDMTDFKHKITSDFGFRNVKRGSKFHPALDIGLPSGTPVYATADGIIESTGYDYNGGGNFINIKHDKGLITQYMHLSKIIVSKGQHVSACDKIGLSGNTGISTGPHLDYRIRFDSEKNKYIDILCPCKTSDRKSRQTYDNKIDMSCAHSLFNAQYKFQSKSDKHSKWRVNHGHCMNNIDDLLPDEM